ncbi:MAG: hypothetical protein WC601_00035 [Desulfotomaculaceae bacterium]
MPLQKVSGGLTNAAGSLIQRTVKPSYEIGGYRKLSHLYNQQLMALTADSAGTTRQAKETVDLIVIPESPYIHFGREFGKDELLALGVGAGATALANILLDWLYDGHCPLHIKAPILAVVQPVVEKPMLVFRHIKNAYDNAEPAGKHDLSWLLGIAKKGLKDGWPTLKADIIYHDSNQAINMGILTCLFDPQTSWLKAAILQAVSFTTAFLEAVFLEVKSVTLKHVLYSRKLHKIGFESERYYELRYMIVPDRPANDPTAVLQNIADKFGLTRFDVGIRYHDKYVREATLAGFNDWGASTRFRDRPTENGKGFMRSVQVVFTKPFELAREKRGAYNCFPVEKWKHYYLFPDNRMYWQAAEIPEQRVGRVIKRIEGKGDYHEVKFWRCGASDPKGLLVTIDIPDRSGKEDTASPYLIEVKVRKNLKLLVAFNNFLLREYPADPITKSKFELTTGKLI